MMTLPPINAIMDEGMKNTHASLGPFEDCSLVPRTFISSTMIDC